MAQHDWQSSTFMDGPAWRCSRCGTVATTGAAPDKPPEPDDFFACTVDGGRYAQIIAALEATKPVLAAVDKALEEWLPK